MSSSASKKNEPFQTRVLGWQIPCPYCKRSQHGVIEVEDNGEDTFWLYLRCDEVGEVRLEYTYADHVKRIAEEEPAP